MNHEPAPGSAPGRTQLILIIAVALLSLGGAYALFYAARSGGTWGTVNQGAFVDPPVTVEELAVRADTGTSFATGGTWWLWVVPKGPCDDTCLQALHQLRQVHVLLNRDASRVRRALVGRADDGGADDHAGLAREYPKLAFLSGNLETLRRGIYVVDPIGNLVLQYPLEDAGKPVLDDLQRLLKVSQIG